MVSAWRVNTKDTLPADTTNVFCSSVPTPPAGASCCRRRKSLSLITIHTSPAGSMGVSTFQRSGAASWFSTTPASSSLRSFCPAKLHRYFTEVPHPYHDTYSILFWYRIRDVSKIQYNKINKINHDTYPIHSDTLSILHRMRTRRRKMIF
jgi:hypothetical protein